MTRSVEIPDAALEAAWRSWNGMHVGTAHDRLRDALVAARPYLMPSRAEIQDALRGASILEAAGDEDNLTLYESGRIADIILALTSGESGE